MSEVLLIANFNHDDQADFFLQNHNKKDVVVFIELDKYLLYKEKGKILKN